MQASEHMMPLKTAKNDAFSLKKSGFKITSGEFLGMYDLDFSCSSIFYQLWTHIKHFKAKKWNWIFAQFQLLFTARPSSERYNDPLKVIPGGSMVEYLPVGPKGAPQTIFGKKLFQAWNP